VSGQIQVPAALTRGERVPDTDWIGDWVGPRASLDDVEKRKFFTLPGLELRPLGGPAGSQSLYRLRYPGSLYILHLYVTSVTAAENSTKSPVIYYISFRTVNFC
jgi:hypothetical protein